MKKRELEKAIELFDSTPGCTLIDNYVNKLSIEEVNELSRFLKFVFADISKTYDDDEGEEYIDNCSKKYICQMSETSRCIFTFALENESGRSIHTESDTDISILFSKYEKSVWVDKFNIAGKGYKGGIDIDELRDWELLLRFIVEKDSRNARSAEIISQESIMNELDNAIQMIDLSDIGE